MFFFFLLDQVWQKVISFYRTQTSSGYSRFVRRYPIPHMGHLLIDWECPNLGLAFRMMVCNQSGKFHHQVQQLLWPTCVCVCVCPCSLWGGRTEIIALCSAWSLFPDTWRPIGCHCKAARLQRGNTLAESDTWMGYVKGFTLNYPLNVFHGGGLR